MRKPADGQWGALNADGTWTGIINEVYKRKADMGTVGESELPNHIICFS